MRFAARSCLRAAVVVAAAASATYAGPLKGSHPEGQAPKLPIVQSNLVPGGRTNFRCITARQSVAIYGRPYARAIRGYLREGDTVNVLRHELHVWPQVVTVVFSHPPFRVGDKFYMLAYEEENYRQVWFRGAVDSKYAFIGDELATQGETCCNQCSPVPTKDCWLHEGPEGREMWWFELRLPTGRIGWTHQPELFNEREDKFCTDSASSACLATTARKDKPPKPPKRSKCREECDRRNRSRDCAGDDGRMVPCPCHCP
jgi:hypothetical protein